MENPFAQFVGSGSTKQVGSRPGTSVGDPFEDALASEGLTGDKAAFVRSIYQQESGSGKNTKTSNAGAVGGMQIIPSTFQEVADPDWDIKDPSHNTRAGVRYASKMWDASGGDPKLAAAGYYGGPGGLEKARKGIAVSDPRNPKAPTTLQYGEQVAARLQKTSGEAQEGGQNVQGNPFDQFVGQTSTPQEKTAPEASNPFSSFLVEPPTQKVGGEESKKDAASVVEDAAKKAVDYIRSSSKNALAVADTILSTPGALLSPVAAATGRWIAIASGAQGDDISKFGSEYGHTVAEKLSNPIHKLLDTVGYTEYKYDETGVGKAMGKVSEIINKGADWVYEKAGGAITLQDAQDLTNAAALLAAPGAVRLTSKALLTTGRIAANAMKKKGPAEVATVREFTPEVSAADGIIPDTLKPIEGTGIPKTPENLAKRIDDLTGVAGVAERAKLKEQYRKEARETFKDESTYNAYLQRVAEKEATLKEPVQVKADLLEENLSAYNQKLQQLKEKYSKEGRPGAILPKPKQENILQVEKALENVDTMQAAMAKLDSLSPAEILNAKFAGLKGPLTLNDIKPIIDKPASKRTPSDIHQLRAFNKQGGGISPELASKLAAVGIGAGVGIWLDPENPIEGALWGVLGGGVALKAGKKVIHPIESLRTLKNALGFRKDPRAEIRKPVNELLDQYDYSIVKAARAAGTIVDQMYMRTPSTDSLNKVTKWIQGAGKDLDGNPIKLTDAEYATAQQARQVFKMVGEEALKKGDLTHLIDNYVTNMWDLSGKNKATWAKISSGMSPNSKFNLQRKITSLEEGKKLGLTPVTENIATILGTYVNAMAKTAANRELLTSLKTTKVLDTQNTMIMPAKTAPKDYVSIDHPTLQGVKVHPYIAKSLEFYYRAKTPGTVLAALEGINAGIKRSNVALSFFHMKALVDAYIGSGGNPLKIIRMMRGKNDFLKMAKEGGAGDLVDLAQQGGLKFSIEKGKYVDEDMSGNAFYKAMEVVQKSMNDIVPGLGTAVKGFENANHWMDKIMWERMHPAMKLETFAKNYEAITRHNAEAHARDPSIRLKTKKENATIAAEYANFTYGGLNWARLSREAATQIGYEIMSRVASPTGRRVMQALLFAPDWTISTTGAATRAFGKGSEIHGKGFFGTVGSGLKGLAKPQELADLHRQYLMRSAVYYLVAGNVMNYVLSGHSIFSNKDPTLLELKDGRRIPFSKHAMEPVHWLLDPLQQAANKLGFVPSEAIAQIASKQYISLPDMDAAPDMEPGIKGHVKHLFGRLLPISAQSSSVEGAVAGTFGFPVYGMTAEQKKEARAKSKAQAKEHAGKKKKSSQKRSNRVKIRD